MNSRIGCSVAATCDGAGLMQVVGRWQAQRQRLQPEQGTHRQERGATAC